MSKLFVADPVILNQEGNKLLDQSNLFVNNVEKIYSTVEDMLASAYLSPAARALGTKIGTYRDDLNAMAKVINEYGAFLKNAGNKVNRNEQNIIDNFSTNSTAN